MTPTYNRLLTKFTVNYTYIILYNSQHRTLVYENSTVGEVAMGTAGRNNVLTSPLSSLHALLYLPFHLPSPLLLLTTLYLPLYLPRSILPPRTIHLPTPHLPHNFPSPPLLTLVLLPLHPISTFETVGRNNVY